MMSLEDIRIYLPKYLSEASLVSLFESLKQFPENINTTLYSDRVAAESESILQGDGLQDMLVVNLPDAKILPHNAVVLSNSCDISQQNASVVPSSVCYCPIFKLEKFEGVVSKTSPDREKLKQFLKQVRAQKVSQIFYLPRGGKLDYEGFVLFDKVCSCDNSAVSRESLSERRLFSLSNFGFYLFVFKLSIHFTRIREGVERY